jgi:hypothetical protein
MARIFRCDWTEGSDQNIVPGWWEMCSDLEIWVNWLNIDGEQRDGQNEIGQLE